MKNILIILSIGLSSIIYSQGNNADCVGALYGCTIDDFAAGSGGGDVDDLPIGTDVSNPSTNPGSAGNSGCLLSNEVNPTWVIFTIATDGFFEFTLGQSGTSGYFDWSLWPYYENPDGTSACNDITGNTLPPVACNWNGLSAGFTGMVEAGNIPAGGIEANFENSFFANAGDQYILCFSNFSGLDNTLIPILTGNDVPGNTASTSTAAVTCDPTAVGQTVCLGDNADVTINLGGLANPTYNWLNGAGDVDDPANGPDFVITPTDTTVYNVEISDAGTIIDTVILTINVAFPPTPAAGVDTTVCLGDVANLDAVISNSKHSIEWTLVGPGLGLIAPSTSAQNATLFTNSAGEFTVTLTESNGVCPDGTDEKLVTFSEASLTATSTPPSCATYADATITITSADGVQYSFDNGVTWQASNIGTGFTAGTYTVCVENSFGCTKCIEVTIVDPSAVVLTVSNDTLICRNGTASLVGNATGGGTMYTYQWSQTPDLSAAQDVMPTTDMTYTVQAFDEFNCPSNSEDINVTLKPELTGTISPDQTVCPGYDKTITAQGMDGDGGPYTYEWRANGIMVSTDQTIVVSPLVSTLYTVTISDGCETTPLELTTNVIVSELPTIDFTVAVDKICEPAVFEIMNGTDLSQVSESYWNISDGQYFTNVNEFSVGLPDPEMYNVQLIVVTPDGCIDSLTKPNFLEVVSAPVAEFNFPSPITMFNTEILLGNSTKGGDYYDWTITSGDPAYSSLKNPTTTFPDGVTGDYPVELIAFNNFGCSDTILKVVSVVSEVIFYAPNSFTPDNDEFNQTWKIIIEGIDEYDFDLFIFNRWGEVIWESHDVNAEWDGTYNGKLLPPGTYTWTVRSKNLINDGKFTKSGHVNIIR